MEFLFILVLLLIVVAVLGGGLYGIGMWLRAKKLAPEEDKLEGEPEQPPRPEHVEVENEQRSRFAATR